MSFDLNIASAFASIGLGAAPVVEADKTAKKAETDAVLAARIASDAKIVKAWAVSCAAFVKLGIALAATPAKVMFRPTGYDLLAIAPSWGDANKAQSYMAHNRANRAIKAVVDMFGDKVTVASAKDGGSIVKTTPETKARGAGGFIATEAARQVAVDWANANASTEVAAYVKEITKAAKADPANGASAYHAAFMLQAAQDADVDALNDDQRAAYVANFKKHASKRQTIDAILAMGAMGTAPSAESDDDDDETGDDGASE